MISARFGADARKSRFIAAGAVLTAFFLGFSLETTHAEPIRNRGINLDRERFNIRGPARTPPPAPSPPKNNGNTNPPTTDHTHHPHHHTHHHTHHGGFGPGVFYYYGDAEYYYPPVEGVYGRIDPNLVLYPPKTETAEPPPPPTPAELIRAGSLREATDLLSEALDDTPGDPVSLRELAIVAVARGDDALATDLIARAYSADPGLAATPITGSSYFRSTYELRRLLVRAVRHAQATTDADAWLLVAVLMQAEGRAPVARRMIDRAAGLGLDPAVVAAWPNHIR